MTGAVWRSAATAALFGLHPLRVESVAWAAERKDVLSGLFWLLTMGAYLRYARRPGTRRYSAALGLFAIGLTAKPMLVTLPCVLLLLDWWPLGRALPAFETGSPSTKGSGSGVWRRLVFEKMPFFGLTLLSSLITLKVQTMNAIPTVNADFVTRLFNAMVSYVRYLGAFMWPRDLAFFYPYPRTGISAGSALVAVGALMIISAAAFALGRRRPYLPVGWLWFLGTLVPMAGLVQVGGQSRSDRYTYISMVGTAIALVWLVGAIRLRRARARGALIVVG